MNFRFELAAVATEELRAMRDYEAEDSPELSRVSTAAMRGIWTAADAEVAGLPGGRVRDRAQVCTTALHRLGSRGVSHRISSPAQGKVVNRLMHEHVAGGVGAECNVCFAAGGAGIACGAGHFTVRAEWGAQ